MTKIKVMVVDDSALVRQVITDILADNLQIEVISSAPDPVIAENYLKKEWPDVILLDIEMPKKDGITFLKEIMKKRPTPVIIISSLTMENARVSMKALSSGAVSVISKPAVGMKQFLIDSKQSLIDSIKSAAKTNSNVLKKVSEKADNVRNNADVILPPPVYGKSLSGDRIVVIGASAGGTQALEYILTRLPSNSPGIAIVQHMPEKFTLAFAERLNRICQVEVKEAVNGDEIVNGKVIIAMGNKHLVLKKNNDRYFTEVKDGPPVSRHKPSVDVLFRSAAKNGGENIMGVILTGMGDDGANGMLEMKNAGCYTVSQSKESCAVYGMPKEAFERGAVNTVLDLDLIPTEILKFVSQEKM